jgi:hypothetical protein
MLHRVCTGGVQWVAAGRDAACLTRPSRAREQPQRPPGGARSTAHACRFWRYGCWGAVLVAARISGTRRTCGTSRLLSRAVRHVTIAVTCGTSRHDCYHVRYVTSRLLSRAVLHDRCQAWGVFLDICCRLRRGTRTSHSQLPCAWQRPPQVPLAGQRRPVVPQAGSQHGQNTRSTTMCSLRQGSRGHQCHK